MSMDIRFIGVVRLEINSVYFKVLLSRCVMVFFFKQKTADEMRISDWSSDVCSSDLVPAGPAQRKEVKPTITHAERRPIIVCKVPWVIRAQLQIGRASCRERVCQ